MNKVLDGNPFHMRDTTTLRVLLYGQTVKTRYLKFNGGKTNVFIDLWDLWKFKKIFLKLVIFIHQKIKNVLNNIFIECKQSWTKSLSSIYELELDKTA